MPRTYARRPIEERFWEKVAKAGENECWPWTAYVDRDGYGSFQLEMGRPIGAHRFAWILINGEIPPGMSICHTCDNPICQNVRHMFIGTAADNNHDRNQKERQSKGEKHYAARLTALQAAEIRSATGETHQQLADRFGISKSHVGHIRTGRKWKT